MSIKWPGKRTGHVTDVEVGITLLGNAILRTLNAISVTKWDLSKRCVGLRDSSGCLCTKQKERKDMPGMCR